MPRTRRTAVLATGTLALVCSLTGCIGGAPASSPAPSTSPAVVGATDEPLDALAAVTTVVARGDALELQDASGAVVDRFEYLDSPATAIEALTVVFGRSPADEHRDAVSFHTPPSILHTWGAFTLDERLYADELREKQESSGLLMPDFMVFFDGPDVGRIRLTTAPGVSAGDALDAVEVSSDPDEQTCVGPAVDPVDAQDSESPEMRVGVALSDFIVDEADQTVTHVDYVAMVVAPVAIGGGCV